MTPEAGKRIAACAVLTTLYRRLGTRLHQFVDLVIADSYSACLRRLKSFSVDLVSVICGGSSSGKMKV